MAFIHTFIASVLVIMLLGCEAPEEDIVFPPANPRIVPASTTEIPLVGSGFGSLESPSIPGVLNQPKVGIPANLISHQTIDINLDGDEVDEQLIIVKQREDQEDLIRIVVVDYDIVRSSYFISWIGLTRSTNLRALTVYTDDVTGNDIPEILAFGLDYKGSQTLDIFQWNTGSTVYGLQYRSILSIDSDAGIEVQNTNNQAGVSKNIVAVNRDLESENLLDTIRTTYSWRRDENRFVLGSSVLVSGSSQIESQLADIFGETESGFMNYLRGPWYKLERNANPEDPRTLKILHVDPTTGSVSLFQPGRTMTYYWVALTKAAYGGRVRVDLRNSVIPSIQIIGNITLQSLDTLNLSITGSETWSFLPNEWNGSYQQLPRSTQSNELVSRNQRLMFNYLDISGLYRSDDGSELFFSNPSLVLRTQGVEESGGYAIFGYGQDTIMQITFLNANGTTSRSLDFKIDFLEEVRETEIRRTLTLSPITLLTQGYTPAGGGRLQFEQRISTD